VVEGESVVPFIGNTARVLGAIESFLDEEIAEASPAAGPGSGRGDGALRIILFTDVEAHSTMIQALGDVRGRDVLREHERVTRTALREFGGNEMKSMGDGFMASFTSVQQALRCAIALQQTFHGAAPVHGHLLRIRVGLNAGEPIAEGDALFGESVNVAERIAGLAQGGEILASQVVRELVAGKGFKFAERAAPDQGSGETALRLYEVRWQE
jgi:class 3 adenylate cyclase